MYLRLNVDAQPGFNDQTDQEGNHGDRTGNHKHLKKPLLEIIVFGDRDIIIEHQDNQRHRD